jgi:hypothetical protein
MYKNFNLTDEERQQIMEQHKSHGYKKPLNEKMFNDEGEPMMSYRQYQDSNKPLEPDYEDMYNDEEEGEDMYNNDDEYYFDAPIGRRLHDGTMIKFRDDNGDEFGGEILKMVHYEDDEPKYEILPNGDRYSTYRYPHEIKIDRSYSPKYDNENRKPLNEFGDKEYDVVRGNPDFKTQTGRPVGDYVNKRAAANQFKQDFQKEFPDPAKEYTPYWEKDKPNSLGDRVDDLTPPIRFTAPKQEVPPKFNKKEELDSLEKKITALRLFKNQFGLDEHMTELYRKLLIKFEEDSRDFFRGGVK